MKTETQEPGFKNYILRIESNRKGGGVLLFHFQVIKKSVQLDLKSPLYLVKCLNVYLEA